MNDILIEKVMMECPICDKVHLVEKRKREGRVKIKGQIVSYDEYYCLCSEQEDEYEFMPGEMMDANLLEARNAYRTKHHMMTSQEITQLRQKYGVTQKELALMLGWGEVTVARYENKQIQDETHDDILKTIRDDALKARHYLETNKESFSLSRFNQIAETIDREIEHTSKLYFTKKQIAAEYIRYQKSSDANGGKQLDIEKVKNMMLFFAGKCRNLYKVKLMKLLWYTDALYFSKYNIGMSGLVYCHMPMGALPLASWNLIDLVPTEIISGENEEMVSYHILPDEDFDINVFSSEEQEVLKAVANKFSTYTGNQLADYMHREIAYTQTKMNQVIPYSLASRISPF